MRTTHTFVKLEVSDAAYLEIWELLANAGYHHAFIDGAIDMHGIALTRNCERNAPAPARFTAQIEEIGSLCTCGHSVDVHGLPNGCTFRGCACKSFRSCEARLNYE